MPISAGKITMPNNIKLRRVSTLPGVTYFKPAGIPLRSLEEINFSVEEAEAIRLKDMENLAQEQCAGKMNISRTTFQRVLESARKKVADALLNGKAIRIEGGNYEITMHRYRCIKGHEWTIPVEKASRNGTCPQCNTSDFVILTTPGRLIKEIPNITEA
jgi:predicted DNA-binding protein (UPF0251 family)